MKNKYNSYVFPTEEKPAVDVPDLISPIETISRASPILTSSGSLSDRYVSDSCKAAYPVNPDLIGTGRLLLIFTIFRRLFSTLTT